MLSCLGGVVAVLEKTSGDLQIVFYCAFILRVVITFSKSVN